jgi:WD40 repeat protein
VFSPDGKSYAISGDRVEIRNVIDGGIINTVTGGHDGLAVYSPDGKQIAVSGDKNIVRVYQVSDMKTIKEFACKDNKRGARNIAFSPDGKWLACTSGMLEEPIILYDTNTWQVKNEIKPIWVHNIGDGGLYISFYIGFTIDSAYVTDGYAFYPISSDKKLQPITDEGVFSSSFTISPDGSLAAGGQRFITIYKIVQPDSLLLDYPKNGDILDHRKPYEFKINSNMNFDKIAWKLVQNQTVIQYIYPGQKTLTIDLNDPLHYKIKTGDLFVYVEVLGKNGVYEQGIVVTVK